MQGTGSWVNDVLTSSVIAIYKDVGNETKGRCNKSSSRPSNKCIKRSLNPLHLFVDLSIRPSLPVNLNLPRQGLLEERLVLVLAQIQWAVRVRFPIRRDVDDRFDVLSSDDEHSGDERVVGFTEDSHGTEGVFAGCFETIEETADEVGGHEDLGQFVVVLVVDPPDGEPFGVEALNGRYRQLSNSKSSTIKPSHSLLVEPRNRTSQSILIRVSPLPVIQLEIALRQIIKRVLGLWLSRNKRLIILIVGLNGLLGLGSLGLLGGSSGSLGLGGFGGGVLLGGGVLGSGLLVGDFAEDGGELGVLDDTTQSHTQTSHPN